MQIALERLSRTASELHLFNFRDADACQWLAVWKATVKVLHLHYDLRLPALSSLNGELGAGLARLPNLVELHISIVEPTETTFTLDFESLVTGIVDSNATLAIGTLSLTFPVLPGSALTLPAALPHLQNLLIKVTANMSSYGWEVPDFDSPLPKVHSLHLAGHDIYALVDSILPARLPSLIHLELESLAQHGAVVGMWLVPLVSNIGAQLSTLRLHQGARLLAWQLDEARELVAGIDNPRLLPLDKPDISPFPSTPFFGHSRPTFDIPEQTVEAINVATRPFVRVLSKFLVDEVERADLFDDDASFAGLAAMLKGLELERLARIG